MASKFGISPWVLECKRLLPSEPFEAFEPIEVSCTHMTWKFKNMAALEVAFCTLSNQAERERFSLESMNGLVATIEVHDMSDMPDMDLMQQIEQFLGKAKAHVLCDTMLSVLLEDMDPEANYKDIICKLALASEAESDTQKLDLYADLITRIDKREAEAHLGASAAMLVYDDLVAAIA
jgi:hypothetical protein